MDRRPSLSVLATANWTVGRPGDETGPTLSPVPSLPQYANFVLQAKNAANEITDVCVRETMLPDVVVPEVHFKFFFFKKTNQLYNIKTEVHHRIVATYVLS